MRSKLLPFLLFAAAAAPAAAQEQPNPAEEAFRLVEAHKVSTRTGCSIPMPAVWNAPPWEQRAAFRRREAFNECLSNAMLREEDRLHELGYRVDDLRGRYPEADWTGIDDALDSKWADLEQLESKLRTQDQWANTAVTILDTFTGPGAPFDSSGYNSMTGYPSPYGSYRRDSSVSAPGIK